MPDFQQHYGLRLTQIVETWPAAEVLLLIDGLPEDSRYAARIAGERYGRGWSTVEFLLLDLRNAQEALRVMTANKGRKKGSKAEPFREWTHYPGASETSRRRKTSKMAAYRKMSRKGQMTATE